MKIRTNSPALIGFILSALLWPASLWAVALSSLEIEGNETTKQSTIIDLLPRSLPADFSESEITEFSRRVKNLALFDFVSTTVEGNVLRLKVRKKATLTPLFGLSTGQTIEDSSATLGLQEYDFNGDGTRVGAKVSYAERGLNFSAWMDEHTYSPNRWAREYEAYRTSSGFRFADEPSKWSRNRLGGFLEWVSPFKYDSNFIYEFQLVSYYEDFTNTAGSPALSNTLYTGGLFEIIYDRYKWDDLAPDGYKLVLELRPGFTTAGKQRSEARFKFIGAVALNDRTSFLLNGNFAAVNSGDVNHSLLVGSQQGLRGLQDSFYRTAVLNFLNAEFRHSLRIAHRFFLQPLAFVDAAIFQPMNSAGSVQPWREGLSAGTGFRLIPTSRADLLLRVDVARIFAPSEGWSTLLGLTQYF